MNRKKRKLAEEWLKRTLEIEHERGVLSHENTDGHGYEPPCDDDSDDTSEADDWKIKESDDDEDDDEGDEDSARYSYGMSWPEAISQMYDTTVNYLNAKEARMEAIGRANQEGASMRRKMRFAFYRKHWKAIMITFLVLILIGAGAFTYNAYQKRIVVGVSPSELIGTDCDYAERLLRDNGFTNIHTQRVSDLAPSELSREGIVSEVTIRGRNTFTRNSQFPYDARVEIVYHVVKNIKVPISSREAKKYDYLELSNVFLDAGFLNIRIEVDYDLATGWLIKA